MKFCTYYEKMLDEKKKAGEQEESKRNSSNLLKGIRLRGALLVNIRPTTGIQAH